MIRAEVAPAEIFHAALIAVAIAVGLLFTVWMLAHLRRNFGPQNGSRDGDA